MADFIYLHNANDLPVVCLKWRTTEFVIAHILSLSLDKSAFPDKLKMDGLSL